MFWGLFWGLGTSESLILKKYLLSVLGYSFLILKWAHTHFQYVWLSHNEGKRQGRCIKMTKIAIIPKPLSLPCKTDVLTQK